MDGYSVLAVVLVNLAFGEALWMDHLMMATGEAPFYAIAAVMFTSMTPFFISVASIHARATAVFHPTASGGRYVRLQRFLVTTATAASMAAVVDRCLALARVNKTSTADARTDV
jgi:hypothetical protein